MIDKKLQAQLREQYKLRNRLPLNSLTIAGVNMPEYANIINEELIVLVLKIGHRRDIYDL